MRQDFIGLASPWPQRVALGLSMLAGVMIAAKPSGAQQAAAPADDGPKWTANCSLTQGQAAWACAVNQELFSADIGGRVLALSLSPGGDGGGLYMTLIFPSGLLLADGVVVKIGAQQPARVPYRAATSGGITAVVSLDAAAVERLRKAKSMTFDVTTSAGQKLSIPVNTAGLSDLLTRVQAVQ